MTAATTPGPTGSDWQRAVLNGLAVQLMRESPRLVRALMAGQVLALTLTAALVPGALLLGAHRSELAELERRWLAWRLLPGR